MNQNNQQPGSADLPELPTSGAFGQGSLLYSGDHMRQYARDAIAASRRVATEWTVDDSELARKIMVFLGQRTSGSMEPGADPLRDRLAEKLAEWRPASLPDVAMPERADDIEQLKEQAGAWETVFEVLCEIAPDWHRGSGRGVEKAVATIRALAAQPAEGSAQVATFDDLETYPSPHGTLVRLADVKCRVWQSERAMPNEMISYQPGKWFDARTLDEMQAFYLSRLPAIREAAKEHGYAIGLHGSERRDFDLMAMQWREDASDKDTLARAIADAACGIRREGAYDWEAKPSGRVATSIPVCWTAHDNPDFDKPSVGHIDLSMIESAAVMRAAPAGWRDALLRSGANTDYHGLVAFTGAQLEHFVSMLAAEGATQAGDARDAARWQFMMRIADNSTGPEAQAMEELGNAQMETDRPESEQMRELVDMAMARIDGDKQGAQGGGK